MMIFRPIGLFGNYGFRSTTILKWFRKKPIDGSRSARKERVSMPEAKSILKAKNLGITFGGAARRARFEIDIKEGEWVGLIGPNGRAKPRFNSFTGVYKPTEGAFYWRQAMNRQKNARVVAAASRARSRTSAVQANDCHGKTS
jgi:ATPase subunit of ABC transporter with duplicated ATPase domains